MRGFLVRQFVLSGATAALVCATYGVLHLGSSASTRWVTPLGTCVCLLATSALLVAAIRHTVELARYTVRAGADAPRRGGPR
jgi:hypothetical protein